MGYEEPWAVHWERQMLRQEAEPGGEPPNGEEALSFHVWTLRRLRHSSYLVRGR